MNQTDHRLKAVIADLPSTAGDWTYYQPLQEARRFNVALEQPFIRRAYHKATEAYYAVRRWEIFEHFKRSSIPPPIDLLPGEQYLYPYQANSRDWDNWLPAGRRPNFHRFVCAGSCHWLAVANLQLAEHLYPDEEWTILSSDLHTTAVCLDKRLFFDLHYLAANVSTEEALDLLFGPKSEGAELFTAEKPYSYLNGAAGVLLDFWEQVDIANGEDPAKVKALLEEAGVMIGV